MTVGVSQFAVDLLTDITHVELPKIGRSVTACAACGEIESVKAVSDLYWPLVDGTIAAVNSDAAANPGLISTEPYGQGWLFKITVKPGTKLDHLLDLKQYEDHVRMERIEPMSTMLTPTGSPGTSTNGPPPHLAATGHPPLADGSEHFVLESATWDDYIRISDGIGERPIHVTFDGSPLAFHGGLRPIANARPRRGVLVSYTLLTPDDRHPMLRTIGAKSIEEMLTQIPADIRLRRRLNLPAAMSEQELTAHIAVLAAKNRSAENAVCFLGGGSYDHFIPAVVDAVAAPQRVLHGLHALSGRGEPGQLAGVLRVSDADLPAHRPWTSPTPASTRAAAPSPRPC